MLGVYDVCTDLQREDIDRIEQVVGALPLVSDVAHADILIFGRAGAGAAVVAHAAPYAVPSLYPRSEVGRTFERRELPLIFRVLDSETVHGSLSGALLWGAPVLQEVFRIVGPDGRILAAVGSNRALLEHERLQRRDQLFRAAVGRVREQALTGQLIGASNLGRLTEHDGILIVDRRGIIRYMTSIAENQYRRVGYVDSLVGEQISEIDTNEYVCFRSMERGVCLEQRIQEGDQVWIKRVVPLFPPPRRRLLGRGRAADPQPDGALVFIQDVTEEVRNEQELRTKSAMIQEVHHRVKNNLQTVASLLRMEARRAESKHARAVLRRTVARISSIAVVHEFLSRGEGDDIDIRDICGRIVAQVRDEAASRRLHIDVSVEGAPFALPSQQATSCALAMNELLENAIQHGFADRQNGSIRIALRATDASAMIEIADDGAGLPEGFQTRESESLGLRIVRTLVEDDLRGQFQLSSGQGVTARISFPRELCRPLV